MSSAACQTASMSDQVVCWGAVLKPKRIPPVLADGRRALLGLLDEQRLELGVELVAGGAVDADVRGEPLEPRRVPPVAVAEELHGRRYQHHADDGRVHEDRRG